MKLGFSAWAMRELPVDCQVEIVRDAGYAAICLISGPGFGLDAAIAGGVSGRGAVSAPADIRALLDAAELELSAIAGHANLLEPDDAGRAANVDRVKATIDLAADLAGPDGPPPVIAMGYGKPERYEVEKHALVLAFGELATYAERRGGVVALEPHVGQAFDEPEKVAWLLEEVGSPHFRLNLDNSHFEVMGRDLDEYLPLLVPYAVHTDLKDQRGRYPNHQFLVPGEGDFDYARYLRAMDQAGYQGCVTVEISVMVQRRPDYDPVDVARRSFQTLLAASRASGVPLVHREPG